MHSNTDVFVGETIGTAILILFGAGVCAAVTLNHSKARAAGWVVIAFGWGFGVLAGAYTAGPLSGGQLNPAVTLGIDIHTGDWDQFYLYVLGQFAGAIIGAVVTWLAYFGQFAANEEPVLGIFSTIPEIRNAWQNLLTEIIATFALVLGVLAFGLTKGLGESGVGTLVVAFLVVGIGLSLGGPTGYAINPARDLGPRIAHFLLPLRGKGSSDWGYSWIPVVGPLIGAAAAAGLFEAAF
jgi:glycerol uptake facilitator protein